MTQPADRKLPWPALIAAIVVIVVAAALFLISRARATRQAAAPPAKPTPVTRVVKPAAPPVRTPTPAPRVRPVATAIPVPTALPTVTPEPTLAPPPPTPVPAPLAAGGQPQPMVVRALRQSPDEVLLAVTFSAPLPEKTKLKVEVGSGEQKLVKRQSVTAKDRVDLGGYIYAFEPELARKARFELGQSISVQLWVGDAPVRQFDIAVTEGSYNTLRPVRIAE